MATPTQQPFEQRFGVKVKVLTLSNGRFPEFFAPDSLRRLGAALYDTRHQRIAALLPPDSLTGRLTPDVTSRWLSVDPLAAKYAHISPYAFSVNSPILFNDPDGREPHIGRVVDGKGNTTITVTTTLVLIGQTEAAVAQITNLNREAAHYLPTQQFDNGNGTTTTVQFVSNVVAVKNDKEYKALDKSLSGATLQARFDADRAGDNAYYAGDITFGPQLTAKSLFHEIGHDFGFADRYLEDENGFAAFLDGYVGTLMADSAPFSQQEAKSLAAGATKTGVYQPIDREQDELKVGSTVSVYKQKLEGGLEATPTSTVVQAGKGLLNETRRMSKPKTN